MLSIVGREVIREGGRIMKERATTIQQNKDDL